MCVRSLSLCQGKPEHNVTDINVITKINNGLLDLCCVVICDLNLIVGAADTDLWPLSALW